MSKVKAKIEKCQQSLDAFLKNPYWQIALANDAWI